MLQNFQEIAEALLAAHPRRAGAWVPTPAAPCPWPRWAVDSWGVWADACAGLHTPGSQECVLPQLPLLGALCAHQRVTPGVGIYTHTVCACTDTPCAPAQPPSTAPLPCAHAGTLSPSSYISLSEHVHTHTHIPPCVLMGPLPTLYPPQTLA